MEDFSIVLDLIMKQLNISQNSYKSVTNIMYRILEDKVNNFTTKFNPNANYISNCGRNAIIKDGDPSAQVIYKAIESENSINMTTCILNQHRKEHQQDDVSVSTVKYFIKQSDLISSNLRGTRKSGSSDVNSPWAVGRYVFADQLKEQLRLAALSPTHDDVLNSPFRPLYLNAFVSWDEKHMKQRVGVSSRIEYHVLKNAYAADGKLGEKRRRVTLKFEEEARTLLGLAVRPGTDGKAEATTLPAFDYTSKIVVGRTEFERKVEEELANKLTQGNIPTATGKKSVWFGGYSQRFGEEAREKATQEVSKKYCNVCRLIDHIYEQSKVAFVGTEMEDKYMVYHDHLLRCRKKGSIAYMKQIGLWDHLIKISGPNNDKVCKLY
jgi:hypothetical protein